jgi:hypothetical protein
MDVPLKDCGCSALPVSAPPAFIPAMRFLPFLFLILASASAQSSAGKILEQGIRQAIAGVSPVPEAEKAAILKATTELLAKHVTFRPDGTASSYNTTGSSRRPTEWKNFVVARITAQAVTEADRLNGISKRYLVGFGCDAHRTWDTKANAWGQWYPIGNVTFPAAIAFEWKNGAWTAAESFQLKFFTPGPGAAIAEPKRSGDDAGLPPGMTRGK